MSQPDINETSWFFRLDELDLLEFDFAALQEHHEDHCDWRQKIEEKIFAEQEAVEDAAQSDLEPRLDDAPMDEGCPIHANDDDDEDELTIKELLTSLVGNSPLASEAYVFVRDLPGKIAAIKESPENYESLFRLQLNAPLVPAKLAFAAHEEEHDDPVSLVIAEKELDMAFGYLSRVLDSLHDLAKDEQLSQADASDTLQRGETLLEHVRTKRDRVRTVIKFRRL
ncbi:MAG: hypothetical protein AAB865_00760 [Patescibacteria group bacterium]